MAFTTPRLAASVLMVRDDPYQVLMVKRNARQPFASALVFPGGVVETEDYSEAWLPLCEGVVVVSVIERALRIAACRESWEEVGLLPGAANVPMARQSGGDFSFLLHAKRQGVTLCLDEIVTFSHWITPEPVPKRFDTYFYICSIRHAERARCDGQETVALEWIEPCEALASEARGERALLLPTRENLKILAQSDSCESAIGAARIRPVVAIMPDWVDGQPSLSSNRLPRL